MTLSEKCRSTVLKGSDAKEAKIYDGPERSATRQKKRPAPTLAPSVFNEFAIRLRLDVDDRHLPALSGSAPAASPPCAMLANGRSDPAAGLGLSCPRERRRISLQLWFRRENRQYCLRNNLCIVRDRDVDTPDSQRRNRTDLRAAACSANADLAVSDLRVLNQSRQHDKNRRWRL